MKNRNLRQLGRKRRHKHTRKKISGTAERPRLSVFRSSRHIYAQLIDDDYGRTLTAASTLAPVLGEELGGAENPIRRGFIVGKELAKRALELKISDCIFDRSGYAYRGRVKAVAEGAREGGLKF